MGAALGEQVLLIQYGPGGQSLYGNFRPPSAGPIEGVQPEVLGGQYRALVGILHDTPKNLKLRFPASDEKAGYEIAGFVWFQGYNDLFDDKGRQQYGANLVHLIKDLRKEFKAPDMKTAVGVMGVNGVKVEEVNIKQKEVRAGQRFVSTVPEFKGNVQAIESAPLLHPDTIAIKTAGWVNKERDLKTQPETPEEKAMLQRATSSPGFHYNGEGRFFILLGKAFAEAMLEMTKK